MFCFIRLHSATLCSTICRSSAALVNTCSLSTLSDQWRPCINVPKRRKTLLVKVGQRRRDCWALRLVASAKNTEPARREQNTFDPLNRQHLLTAPDNLSTFICRLSLIALGRRRRVHRPPSQAGVLPQLRLRLLRDRILLYLLFVSFPFS